MFRVSYASALMYFLQKFHEERPDLRLSVVYDESLDSFEEVFFIFAIVIWSDHRELIDCFEHECMALDVSLADWPPTPCEFDWRCVNLDEHNILEGIV